MTEQTAENKMTGGSGQIDRVPASCTRSETAAKGTPGIDPPRRSLREILDRMEQEEGALREKYLDFLAAHTPEEMARNLDLRVIGQPELTMETARFLYYHILRQVYPQLPPRTMLIYGPSGCGKTEVWRAAEKAFPGLVSICVVDGSNLTAEGWTGSLKLTDVLCRAEMKRGILVLDEFDKAAEPVHNASGDNVALGIQYQMLKLVEGEYSVENKKKGIRFDTRSMGVVFTGAFDSLTRRKRESAMGSKLGFSQASGDGPVETPELTETDFIRWGVVPELMGRIAVRCRVRELDEDDCLKILYSPFSRLRVIGEVLETAFGLDRNDLLPEEEIRG